MDIMHASYDNEPVEVVAAFEQQEQQLNLQYVTEHDYNETTCEEAPEEPIIIDEGFDFNSTTPTPDSTTVSDQTELEESPSDDSAGDGKTRKESREDGDEGSRRKRQTQRRPTKYLEVRVAVDLDMVRYHAGNVIPYTLTLMNIVSY